MKLIPIIGLPSRAVYVLTILLVITAIAPQESEFWKDSIGIGGLVLFAATLALTRNPDRRLQSLSFAGAVYIWFGLFGALKTLFFLLSPLWDRSTTIAAAGIFLAIAVLGIKIYQSRLLYIRIGLGLAMLQVIGFLLLTERSFRSESDLSGKLSSIAALLFSLALLAILYLASKQNVSAAAEEEQIGSPAGGKK